MKLYDLKASPNARRVRIFLAEKGVEIPSQEIDLSTGFHKSPEYLEKNILGRMPLLELDDGVCISESHAICRYLEEEYPTPPLMGRTQVERAQVEMWNRRMELELLHPLINIFSHTHPMWKNIRTQVPDWAEVCRIHATETIDWMETTLEGREFLATDDYTVADITAQCAILIGKAVGVRVPETHQNLTDWWGRVTSRPTARA
ncbi:MAG: glutathione S-transferase family protein [Sneathiella sp.]|uniref:glutathione S-transferase family protein n=1 Tax=Sneathiella sp. TaxID=1964365 RepID=UPI0030037397